MPRYYVSAIYDHDMLMTTKRPIRARNPKHAEAKFVGSWGRQVSSSDYAERVVRWGNRNKFVKNLLKGGHK